MLRFLLLGTTMLFAAGCGGPSMAKVKGRVVENGQPIASQGQASLVLVPVGEDGKPGTKTYVMEIVADGSFELLASGGELLPGAYEVTLEINGKQAASGVAKFKGAYSHVRIELNSGVNDLTLDLTKPKG